MRKIKRILAFVFAISVLLTSMLPHSSRALAEGSEEQLQQKIDQIVAGIPSSATTDADKALYLHDYIVRNVAYEMVGDHQTAYGALLDGVAVCAGYADAYLRLLTAVGIQARTIRGTADNGSGVPQGHAWTMLYIDGKCLFTDVTWDDPFINGVQDPNNVSHDYFNLTMERMHTDHFPDAEYLQYLPDSCNHTGYDFYSINQGEGTGYGIFSSATTAKEAAKYFKYTGKIDNADAFTCEFRFDGGVAREWISSNWSQIAQELGLTGSLSASYQLGGYTVKLTVTGTLISKVAVTSVSVSPESVTLRAIGATVQLTSAVSPANATDKTVSYSSSNPQVATVSPEGLITAVANGTAIITVTTRDGGKTAACSVTVSIPAPPPPEETTEPTTEPPQQTEPVTEPSQATEPNQPTEPVTQPTQPSESATEPTEPSESTEPVAGTDSTEPSATTTPTNPTVLDPTTAPTMPGGMTADPVVTDPTQTQAHTATPTQPPATNNPNRDNSVVIIAALCGGGLILVFLIFFLRKRR